MNKRPGRGFAIGGAEPCAQAPDGGVGEAGGPQHEERDRHVTPGDFRLRSPRFNDAANLEHNLALVERLRAIAEEHDATVAKIAIAWVGSRGADILPLVGARRRDRLHEALGAADVELSPADLARIEEVVPAGAAAGTRYDAHGMGQLDSER